MRHGTELADLQRVHAEFRATLSENALAYVQADAAMISQPAIGFAAIQSNLEPRITALSKESRNLDAAINVANRNIPWIVR